MYFATGESIYALKAGTGALLWTSTVAGRTTPPAVTSEAVYVLASGSVSALNATTGVLLWSYFVGGYEDVGDDYDRYSPAVANGVVYVASDNELTSWIYALNATTGALLWSYPSYWSPEPPTVANGVVYFGDRGGALNALDASTGALLWSRGFELVTGPVAIVDGTLFVESWDYYADVTAWGLPDGAGVSKATRPDSATLQRDSNLKVSQPVAKPPADDK